jgi:DNA-binding LacI/PurR family transcriptional regulator
VATLDLTPADHGAPALAEMAATAVRLVLAQGGGEAAEGHSIELATSLVTRETTSVFP